MPSQVKLPNPLAAGWLEFGGTENLAPVALRPAVSHGLPLARKDGMFQKMVYLPPFESLHLVNLEYQILDFCRGVRLQTVCF